LAMACKDTCYSFFVVSLAKVFVLLCLLDLSPASHNGVTLLLEGSLKPCHLPLPAGREVAGIGLWEWWWELEGSLVCSSEQLLLLLKENSVHVTNCDSEVLCNARRALSEQENSLHCSSFDHLFAAAVKADSR
jgi:hypothetical protein